MTAHARFREADLTRALKAAKKAGVLVRARFSTDGQIEVEMLTPGEEGEQRGNPLDRLHRHG